MKFSELKIGQSFIDPRNPDDVCVKSSDSGAVDAWCAKGFELSFNPDERVCEK